MGRHRSESSTPAQKLWRGSSGRGAAAAAAGGEAEGEGEQQGFKREGGASEIQN